MATPYCVWTLDTGSDQQSATSLEYVGTLNTWLIFLSVDLYFHLNCSSKLFMKYEITYSNTRHVPYIYRFTWWLSECITWIPADACTPRTACSCHWATFVEVHEQCKIKASADDKTLPKKKSYWIGINVQAEQKRAQQTPRTEKEMDGGPFTPCIQSSLFLPHEHGYFSSPSIIPPLSSYPRSARYIHLPFKIVSKEPSGVYGWNTALNKIQTDCFENVGEPPSWTCNCPHWCLVKWNMMSCITEILGAVSAVTDWLL